MDRLVGYDLGMYSWIAELCCHAIKLLYYEYLCKYNYKPASAMQ